MVQGIIAYFVGGACGAFVLGVIDCLWRDLGEDMSCGTISLIAAVLVLSAGFLPFIVIAGFAARRIAARPLWWLSFTTGLLLTPGIASVSGLAHVLTGFEIDACVGGLKPICSIGAGLVAEAVIFVTAWAIFVMVTKRRRAAV